MTMVSELVLTRNQLLEVSRQQEDAKLKAPLQRLSLITAELGQVKRAALFLIVICHCAVARKVVAQ